MTDSSNRMPALWFDKKGCGPDEMAIELHHFPAEMDGKIPARLGLRIRADGIVIMGKDLVDGGFYMEREQAADLHRQLGEWLEANP